MKTFIIIAFTAFTFIFWNPIRNNKCYHSETWARQNQNR